MMQPTDALQPAGHFIPTLVERTGKGLLVSAFCPVCDKMEQSIEQENAGGHATVASIIRIRAHMKARHQMAAVQI
jgi:hypothetical protein